MVFPQTRSRHAVYTLITANQATFSIGVMCKHLQVSTSGYYEWRSRSPSCRQLANAALYAQITQVHQASDATYEVPRVHAQLRHQGLRVNLKRVERLMRVLGLQGVSRRRGFVVTTKRNHQDRPAPDLVRRCFVADDINQLWGLI